MTIIYAVIIFCMLIFVHELGHFLVAKACGVKVNEFAIGMGPAIVKRQRGETLYSVRALPVGGYCAMEGEDEDSDDERAFNNKPAWKRALILAAGSSDRCDTDDNNRSLVRSGDDYRRQCPRRISGI